MVCEKNFPQDLLAILKNQVVASKKYGEIIFRLNSEDAERIVNWVERYGL